MRRRTFLGAITVSVLGLGGCGKEPEVIIRYTPRSPIPKSSVEATPVPAPELIVSSESLPQAGTVLVSVVGAVRGGSITFLDRTSPLTRGAQSMYAFLGIGTGDPPGRHTAKIDYVQSTGSIGSVPLAITVLPANWTVDSIILPPRLQPLLDPAVTARELDLLSAVYQTTTPAKLWSGAWQLPVQGAVTTRFGEQRSYNNAPVSGHHSGTDLGAASGTPVAVTNSGVVVMARQLQLRGNMVVVDHGGGVLSGYAHLDSFAVAEGQLVATGEAAGFVGSTGLSTGAHLHWELSVGGVLVDALRFVDGSNGF